LKCGEKIFKGKDIQGKRRHVVVRFSLYTSMDKVDDSASSAAD
jgi:hypothetical protein